MSNQPAFVDQLSEYLKGGVRQELAFSTSEYHRRLGHATTRMRGADLNVLLLTHLPTICYLTGYQFTNCDYTGYLLLNENGGAAMVVPGTEVGAVLLHGWVRDVRDFPSWLPLDAVPIITEIVADWNAAQSQIGIESQLELMDPLVLEHLRESLPQVQFYDATSLLSRERGIKSPLELKHLEQAARYSDLGMLAACSQAAPGTRENEIAATASEAMILAGSEFFSIAPIVASGSRTELPRAPFSHRRLLDGELAVVELGGVFQRYTAPLMRTLLSEPVDANAFELYDVACSAFDALVRLAQPGAAVGEVIGTVRNEMIGSLGDDARVPWSLGHSIGLSMPPDWVELWPALDASATDVFEIGMTFYSPIRLNREGIGIGVGESWHVTAEGGEVLSRLPRALHGWNMGSR